VAASIIYLGLALVLSSRDLAARASFVYWEGILRVVAFFLFAGFGFLGGLGALTRIRNSRRGRIMEICIRPGRPFSSGDRHEIT
jgi:hypothetical protein